MFAGLFLGLKSFFSGLLSTIIGVVKNLLVWVTSSIENMVIASLVVLVIFLSIGIHSRNVDIEKLSNDLNKSKTLNSYYLTQFKALALSYNTSLQEFKTQKNKIELKYKDRIVEAKKIPINKECGYTTKRIKEYVENNNSN